MGRLIFRAFQSEMELDYTTVSRLLLVLVVNVCESIKNWFPLIYQNYPGCNIALCCLVYDFEISYVSGS